MLNKVLDISLPAIMKAQYVLPFLLLIGTCDAVGQSNVRDSSIFMTMVSPSYAYQIPGGNMAERFGHNSNMGLSVTVKRPSNLLLGFHGTFIFGDNVHEPNLGHGLINEDGTITDVFGEPAEILLFERGWTATFEIGKIIPNIGPNPNSGIMLKLGVGYMQHKIRIEHQTSEVPQIEGDYIKGYDRLTGGPLLTEFIGYQYLGTAKFANFFFGFEFMQGLTTDLRSYNIDTQQRDSGARLDMLSGFRFGWTLPIYKRAPADIYIY